MNILYLMYRLPYPLDRGDKLRAFNQIKFLSKRHNVFLCSIDNKDQREIDNTPLKSICKKIFAFNMTKTKIIWNLFLNFITGKPLQNAFVFDGGIKKRIEQIIVENKIEHSICLMVRPADYLASSAVPKTLDYQDVLSVGFERRSKSLGMIKRIIYKMEARRLARYERLMLDKFDNKVIITIEDRNLFPSERRAEIQIVGNGIDLEYFKPDDTARNFDLLFVGNMMYEPNIVSMLHFVNNILPLIRKELPEVKLMIAGADPVESIRNLQSESVVVTGTLPDIRTAYRRGKVFIAPMLLGTGLQNKLLEAMAMKIPVVTSELCNKGLGAIEGQHLLIGRTDEEYAEHCVSLLSDSQQSDKLSNAAYQYIEQNFSWEAMNQKLEDLIMK